MKYIRSFFESIGEGFIEKKIDDVNNESLSFFNWGKKRLSDKELYDRSFEIKSFCEDYLSYLLDTAYSISIENHFGKNQNQTFILYMNNFIKEGNTWLDVSSNFLPFVEIFDKEYGIDGDIRVRVYDERETILLNISLSAILNDNLGRSSLLKDDSIITNISFEIKK